MGMDIYGMYPTAAAGVEFRAGFGSWAPIVNLIRELCDDLFTPEELHMLGYNEGAGPDDQATCTEMANRFEGWLERNTNAPDSISKSDEAFIRRWMEFMRNCGGFRVC